MSTSTFQPADELSDVTGHGRYTGRFLPEGKMSGLEREVEGHCLRGPLLPPDADVEGHGFRAP